MVCRRAQILGMLTDTIILAHRRTLFWQVNGQRRQSSLACRREHLFACRWRQSCLACRRGQPFWHVDGRFGMSTRRIPACTCICIYIYENENANLNVQSHLYVYVICFVSKRVFMEMCMNACM